MPFHKDTRVSFRHTEGTSLTHRRMAHMTANLADGPYKEQLDFDVGSPWAGLETGDGAKWKRFEVRCPDGGAQQVTATVLVKVPADQEPASAAENDAAVERHQADDNGDRERR